MATTRFIDHLLEGDHASRPAANAVPEGTLYSCTTHNLIYQSDGTSTWSTWATLSAGLDLDATIAASAGQDIADALAGAASPDAGNVFATMADVGGGAADLVQTYSGAGSVYVPGLRGSADALPSSPNAADDEFETLSGWTTLGSLTTSNVSDVPSHWHVSKANAGLQLHGIYKAAPSTPFTITCKLSECALDNGNYTNYGIIIGDSTPTKWYSFTLGVFQDNLASETWTNSTTRATSSNALSSASVKARYLRLLVSSSTSVTGSWSKDGHLWTAAFSGVNPGSFTAANFGLAVQANGVTAEAYFDWIRVV